MSAAPNSETFEDIVEWAYSTLPEKIRELPDFPGIQVLDEPPREMFEQMSRARNWPRGTQLLGCFSGISRIGRHFNLIPTAPDLIFVFRGPILRCSRGDLSAEVKRVVWHEVAHWLGHNEEEMTELGLASSSPWAEDAAPHDTEAPGTISRPESSRNRRPRKQ